MAYYGLACKQVGVSDCDCYGICDHEPVVFSCLCICCSGDEVLHLRMDRLYLLCCDFRLLAWLWYVLSGVGGSVAPVCLSVLR